MAKQLKQFYIEPEQVKYLERQSKRTGKSQAQIVRELIDHQKFREVGVDIPPIKMEEGHPANKVHHITDEIKFKPTHYSDECYLGWLYDEDSSIKLSIWKGLVREVDEDFIEECQKRLNSEVAEMYNYKEREQ